MEIADALSNPATRRIEPILGACRLFRSRVNRAIALVSRGIPVTKFSDVGRVPRVGSIPKPCIGTVIGQVAGRIPRPSSVGRGIVKVPKGASFLASGAIAQISELRFVVIPVSWALPIWRDIPVACLILPLRSC